MDGLLLLKSACCVSCLSERRSPMLYAVVDADILCCRRRELPCQSTGRGLLFAPVGLVKAKGRSAEVMQVKSSRCDSATCLLRVEGSRRQCQCHPKTCDRAGGRGCDMCLDKDGAEGKGVQPGAQNEVCCAQDRFMWSYCSSTESKVRVQPAARTGPPRTPIHGRHGAARAPAEGRWSSETTCA